MRDALLLPQTAEYAIRAVLYIAAQQPGAVAPVSEVARGVSLPQNYLSKTLNQLVRTGVLKSTRGPKGGFSLALPVRSISLARILSNNAQTSPARCLLGLGKCGEVPECAVHSRWKAIAALNREFFANTTIAHLLEQSTHNEARTS